MKKIGLMLGLYILTAMLIAGCGNQSQNTGEGSGGQNAEESPAETPGEAEEESPEGGLQTVDGTIRSFTGGYLSIRDENGDLRGFEMGDAELACENGILAGEEVTLEYVSEEDELTNEEVARLLKVSDREGAKPLGEETMEGTVLDASANTLTVQGIGENSRDIITFFTVGTEFHCGQGIGPDDEVTLTYRGELQGSNARSVKVLSVTDTPKETDTPEGTAAPEETDIPEGTAAPEEEKKAGAEKKADEVPVDEIVEDTLQEAQDAGETAMEDALSDLEDPDAAEKSDGKPVEADGSIVRVDGTLLVAELEDEPEAEYEFDLSDTKIDLKYGLLEGSEVVLTYMENAEETADGTAAGNSEATPLLSLTDVDPEVVNESTGGFSITGTVMAMGTSAMTVTSDDGAQITCTTEDVEFDGDAEELPGEGAYVVVVIEPDSDSNVYRALSVARAY